MIAATMARKLSDITASSQTFCRFAIFNVTNFVSWVNLLVMSVLTDFGDYEYEQGHISEDVKDS